MDLRWIGKERRLGRRGDGLGKNGKGTRWIDMAERHIKSHSLDTTLRLLRRYLEPPEQPTRHIILAEMQTCILNGGPFRIETSLQSPVIRSQPQEMKMSKAHLVFVRS
jgi:hypothetical protein